ncbi:MAG: Ycf66 family protein [Microcoleaceae cyanobacterium]
MLANILALAVGLGSLALYLVAFFFPEVHRKNDFIWSGIGLFYALILWFCARRITGAVLLGQVASVTLLGWFGWQTFTLRRQLTPLLEQTKISTKQSQAEKSAKLTNPFPKKKDKTQKPSTPVTQTPPRPKLDITETATETETETESLATPNPNQEFETATTPNLTSSATPVEPEITSDSSPPITESLVDRTVAETKPATEAETNTKIQQITTTPKKSGGFSQLLTPVTGILGNIKNAIQTRGSKKTGSASTAIPPEIDKFSSIEELTSKANEPITTIQETQPAQESVTETENTATSDIQTEEASFVEIQEKIIPSPEPESISVEEVVSEQIVDPEKVDTVENNLESSKIDSPSPKEITAQDSANEEDKSQSVSSEQNP